jgi:hypothetical protein
MSARKRKSRLRAVSIQPQRDLIDRLTRELRRSRGGPARSNRAGNHRFPPHLGR